MVSKCTLLGCATLTSAQRDPRLRPTRAPDLCWTAPRLVDNPEPQAEACSTASGLIPPRRPRLPEPPLTQFRWPINCDRLLLPIDGCYCGLLNATGSPSNFPFGMEDQPATLNCFQCPLALAADFHPSAAKVASQLEAAVGRDGFAATPALRDRTHTVGLLPLADFLSHRAGERPVRGSLWPFAATWRAAKGVRPLDDCCSNR